jgi:hypothetical protein
MILKSLENPGALYFCRNTHLFYSNYVIAPAILQKNHKLFQNYILVPAILHLGPYLFFYNYN